MDVGNAAGVVPDTLREVYERAGIVRTGQFLTTINELCDQVPALRPRTLWAAAAELVRIGSFNSTKILSEEDKGAPLATAVSLMTGMPLCMAKWYPYELDGQVKLPITNEYFSGHLYVNGIEPGDTVTIVDDTLSTGGTLLSLLEGVRKRGVTVSEILVLVEKVDNGGRARLEAVTDIPVRTVMKIRVSEQGVVVL